jgi:hypothetical protein
VFLDLFGKPMRRWTLDRRSFAPLLEQAGLPCAITFHGLRHTFATRPDEDVGAFWCPSLWDQVCRNLSVPEVGLEPTRPSRGTGF